MSRLNLLEGAALGASAVYLLDRDRGKARRHALAARMGKAARAALNTSVTKLQHRSRTRIGRRRYAMAVVRPSERGWARFLRRGRPATSSWDIPMATVNIDIDQGTVTLRGVFPPMDEDPPEARTGAISPRPSMHVVETEG